MALDHNTLTVQCIHPCPRQTTRLQKERLPHGDGMYEFWVVHSQLTSTHSQNGFLERSAESFSLEIALSTPAELPWPSNMLIMSVLSALFPRWLWKIKKMSMAMPPWTTENEETHRLGVVDFARLSDWVKISICSTYVHDKEPLWCTFWPRPLGWNTPDGLLGLSWPCPCAWRLEKRPFVLLELEISVREMKKRIILF